MEAGALSVPERLSAFVLEAPLARLRAAETKHAILQERKHSAVKIAPDCFSLSNSNKTRTRLLLGRILFLFESPRRCVMALASK